MQSTNSNSSHHKRTNSHIMGFFALLLLIVVVAISVDRLKQSQDVRNEARVICPNGQCDPEEPANLAPTVTVAPLKTGPFYLYNFYEYDIFPNVFHNLEYEVAVTSTREVNAIELKFVVPKSAEVDPFILNSNLTPAPSLNLRDEISGDDRIITLNFSGLTPLWVNPQTTLELGVFRARPTELGEFVVQLPENLNPLIQVNEGGQWLTSNILPSLEMTMSLEPETSSPYRLNYTVKNINPVREVYLGRTTLVLNKPNGTVVDIPNIASGGHLSPGESNPFFARINQSLSVGDKFILRFQPGDTVINELPEVGVLEVTQAVLDEINARRKYDLSLETINTELIKNLYASDEPIEYGLQIKNSTNQTSNPITALNVDLDIMSSQRGVTAYNTRAGSNCTNQGLTWPVVLRCNYAHVGDVLPLKIKILGAGPGDITLTNKLTVNGNPLNELSNANNTLVLMTTLATPTTPEYDIADIAGGPNGGPDGLVDLADYTLLVSQLGETGIPGFHPADITGSKYGVPDGIVDLSDYTLLVDHLGS